ncbi:MAG: hypothetical protein MUC45_11765 [Actinomycetia bacterium]|nr:hypothetical protein [Actinomycetes bacterium]
MGATEHRTSRGDQPRRRFVTRTDVEDAAAAGRPVRVGARDVLTHEAAQRARDLGVPVERDGTGARPAPGPAAPTPPRPSATPAAAELRAVVRSAVIAELGHEPAGLDAAIDRVLAGRPAP